ncbi:T9SS type A sorting domain-containing protein [bacterium]|nr:T9SS type A sorting domain-containing protein [bacterium]
MFFRTAILLLFVLILSITQPITARVINVPDDYEVIQDGVEASRPGDTLLVHPGEYEHCELTINHDLTLAGEYLLTGDEDSIEESILYGDQGRTTIYINDRQINLWLVGLKISDGNYGLQCGSDPCIYISHCLFNNNEYAIQFAGLSIVVSNTSFLDNGGVSVVSYYHHGGAGSMRIQDCNFQGNSQLTLLCGGVASIRHCAFINNQSGLEIVSRTVYDCYFEGNSSEGNGGALNLSGASVVNCTFIGNHGQNGGAIYGFGDIRSCIFIGNTSENQGGAIYGYPYGGDFSVNNCTFFENISSAGEGGDIYYETDQYSRQAILSNSILIAGNPRAIDYNQNQESVFTVSYCNIQGGQENIVGDGGQFTWGDGNIDEDPLFIDPDHDDFRLTEDSPCIDGGDPESDPDPDGTCADMGAYYFHQRDIEIDSEALHFGGVDAGNVDSLSLLINNIGLNTLRIDSIWVSPVDLPFYLRWDREFLDIEPAGSYTECIRFAPEDLDEFRAVLVIDSNDPDEGTILVQLTGSSLSIKDAEDQAPSDFAITSAFPNPFNSETIINYSIPQSGIVSLGIYDLSGREITSLYNGHRKAGNYSETWNANGISTGMYICRLDHGSRSEAVKLVVVR